MSNFLLWLVIAAWIAAAAIKTACGRQPHVFDKVATIPLRGILAMLVVLGHMAKETACDFGFLKAVCWQQQAVGVFFFLSGYGMSVSSGQRADYMRNFLPRTAAKLFFPLCVIMVATAIYEMATGRFRMADIATAYLHGNTALCPYSWYVFELFLLAIIFFYANRLSRSNYLTSLAITMCGAVLTLIAFRHVFHWPPWWQLSLMAFPMGMAFATFEHRIKKSIAQSKWRFHVLLILVWTSVSAMQFFGGFWTQFILQGTIGVVVVSCSLAAPIPKWKWLIFLGGISYELYLVHGIVKNNVCRRLVMIDVDLAGVVNILATILIAWFFNRVRRQFIRVA